MAKLGKYTKGDEKVPMVRDTNGGNGGYERRQAMNDGVRDALKLNDTGKFAATGVTRKKSGK